MIGTQLITCTCTALVILNVNWDLLTSVAAVALEKLPYQNELAKQN